MNDAAKEKEITQCGGCGSVSRVRSLGIFGWLCMDCGRWTIRRPTPPRVLGDGQYRCAACGGVFLLEVSDEEAIAEAIALFPQEFAAGEPFELTCDDCWRAAGFAEPVSLV